MMRLLLLVLLLLCAQPVLAREITDDLGRQVTVPDHPLRIVSTYDASITLPLLELGVTPLASHGRLGKDGKPTLRGGKLLLHEDFDTTGMVFIGAAGVDLERLMALKPDLILADLSRPTPVELLQRIAPTVAIDSTRGVPHVYPILARLTGTEDRLATLQTAYRARIEALRAALPTGQITVSVVQALRGKLQVYQSYRALGQVLRDAGFRFVPLMAAMKPYQEMAVSVEMLPDFDADMIFNPYRSDRGAGPEAELAAMNAMVPGFCNYLAACRAGHYVMVPREIAISNSYAALNLMIDQVRTAFGLPPDTSATPRPAPETRP